MLRFLDPRAITKEYPFHHICWVEESSSLD
jgi:hypothetical protein